MIVVGAGGHAKVIVALARELGVDVEVCFDDDPARHGTMLLGVPVRATEPLRGRRAVLAIGNNRARQRLASSLDAAWTSLVHPRAFVDRTVSVGVGAVIFAGAVVQPDAKIGAHAIVNTGATVDHDCVLSDFVHIAPGVHLAGNVSLHEGVFLGVGVSVIPGKTVGAWTTVGAGAAVVRDLPADVVAVGVPARVTKPAQTNGRS